MSFTRLQTIDPVLVEQLRAAPHDALRKVSHAVADAAAQHIGLQDPLIEQALTQLRHGRGPTRQLRDQLAGLVEELDQRAWNLQDRTEQGAATEDYPQAFATARAAAAVLSALGSPPDEAVLEAVYEAHAATGDLTAIRAAVHSALTEA